MNPSPWNPSKKDLCKPTDRRHGEFLVSFHFELHVAFSTIQRFDRAHFISGWTYSALPSYARGFLSLLADASKVQLTKQWMHHSNNFVLSPSPLKVLFIDDILHSIVNYLTINCAQNIFCIQWMVDTISRSQTIDICYSLPFDQMRRTHFPRWKFLRKVISPAKMFRIISLLISNNNWYS